MLADKRANKKASLVLQRWKGYAVNNKYTLYLQHIQIMKFKLCLYFLVVFYVEELSNIWYLRERSSHSVLTIKDLIRHDYMQCNKYAGKVREGHGINCWDAEASCYGRKYVGGYPSVWIGSIQSTIFSKVHMF
jgi:hypothetical protein